MAVTTKQKFSQINPPQLEDLPFKDYDPEVAREMLAFVKPYRGKVGVSIIYMMLSSLASVAVPYLIEVAIDQGLAKNSVTVLRNMVLLFIVVQIIQWIFNYLRTNVMAFVGQSIIYDVRSSIFRRLQELSLSFFSRFSVGRIISRMMNDVNVLRDFITWTLLAVVAIFSPWLALL